MKRPYLLARCAAVQKHPQGGRGVWSLQGGMQGGQAYKPWEKSELIVNCNSLKVSLERAQLYEDQAEMGQPTG